MAKRGGLGFAVSDKRAGRVVLELEGEMAGPDLAGPLKAAIEPLYGDDDVRLLRVDVAALDFIDNVGVATLVGLLRDCGEHGVELRVAGAEGQVRNKLRVTGMLRRLERAV